MRTISFPRVFTGLPYVLLGVIITCVFLLFYNSVADNNDIEFLSGPCAGTNAASRKLRNPCSLAKRDEEKEVMIKLMTNLLDRLNKSIDVQYMIPDATGQIQKQQLKSWVPKKKNSIKNQSQTLSHFQTSVTEAEKKAVYKALLKLESISKEHDFKWMLYSGTLLGSWRHHDMIPWDDDFDIFMNYTQREEVKAILSNLGPEFEFFEAGSRMKFWATEGTVKSSTYPWKWPYLDISFFKENKTHVWDGSMEDDYGDRLYMYPKSIVFPLHKRPMGEYYFPAPRDSYAHLKATYKAGGMGMCWTTHYSHKNEALTDKVHKIMCKELKKIYPFVHRTVAPDGKGIYESLRLDDEEIHKVLVEEPTYAITEPYAINLI